jgi:hypothetical protein
MGLSGCAPALPEAAQGPAPWRDSGYSSSATPKQSGQEAAPRAELPRTVAKAKGEPVRVLPERPTVQLVSNEACLRELKAAGVSFQRATRTRGVETPVIVRGKVGGLSFWANDKRPLLLDCRLALALQRLEPLFARHHVSQARFSGAYVMKTTRTGRLSHHAYGLAIDIHSLTIDGEVFEVKNGFEKGVGCERTGTPLNQLACDLRQSGLFEEFLTPDYNYDHRDHLHLAVPLKGQRALAAKSGLLVGRR